MEAETLAQLKLHLVPGLGPKTTRALLNQFGSAEQVLNAFAADLALVPNISEKTAVRLVKIFSELDTATEQALIEKHQVQLLMEQSPGYPTALRPIDTAPALLYCRGSLLDVDQRAIAIVGSRHSTSYGQRTATRLAEGLARAGWTIVSGLARGIDGIAHQAALNAGGRTIAVLANGLARIYPTEHKDLAEKITAQGAVLSEMPMATPPQAELFPRRNRIISGLSRAVIIVEAALRSGALITARLAGEQCREVLAVPGPIDSEASAGPHQLIRDGATLIRSVDDALEALGALPALDSSGAGVEVPAINSEPPPNLTPVQLQIWHSLGSDSALVDELVASTALPVSELNSALLMMELTGRIRRLPGNRFARK